jgi:hypothetical protein
VEGPRRHQVLPRLHRPRPLPTVGLCRRLLGVVEDRLARIRLFRRDRLVLAGDGRVHDQGAVGGGKRRGRTPPTAPRKASSAVCWSRAAACRWVWR